MRATTQHDLAGVGSFEVYELTLGEIRQWLVKATQGAGDVVDAALFEAFDPQDLRILTSLSPERIEAMTPTQLRDVYALCLEANQDFFALRRRVVAMGQTLLSAGSKSPSPV